MHLLLKFFLSCDSIENPSTNIFFLYDFFCFCHINFSFQSYPASFPYSPFTSPFPKVTNTEYSFLKNLPFPCLLQSEVQLETNHRPHGELSRHPPAPSARPPRLLVAVACFANLSSHCPRGSNPHHSTYNSNPIMPLPISLHGLIV